MNNYFFYKLLLIFLFFSLESGRTIPYTKKDDQLEKFGEKLRRPSKTIAKKTPSRTIIRFSSKIPRKPKKPTEKKEQRKKTKKVLTLLKAPLLRDRNDPIFNIDSDKNLKLLAQANKQAIFIDLEQKETDEIVDVEKK